MKMIQFFFDIVLPLLVIFYLIVDIIIPSFTSWKYFWFIKSLPGKKPKPSSFEKEVQDAEKAYKDAQDKLNSLQKSAGNERMDAERRLDQAEQVVIDAKAKLKKFKK
jgi:hypothetical protein